MNTLIIRHVYSEKSLDFFRVVRQRDGKGTANAVPAISPVGFPVEGLPESDLMRELRWYLEDFLGYPFSPNVERAERVQAALRKWGEQAFVSLFGDRDGGRFFDEATRDGYEKLHLQISSDNPLVLGWPWEALRDPQAAGPLAQACQIERHLNDIRDPYDLPAELPKDRINILLVTARPLKDDVQYRSISRPLIELIESEKLPAKVKILRPPTFDELRNELRAHPGHYHIVHFDGHGSYGGEAENGGGYVLRSPLGRLYFENSEGKEDPKTAEQLGALLREHRIPAVVLNACQSAMVDGAAADPFASVAAALLKGGVRSVVAMAYSLYVSGAREFLPAFYRELFRTGDVAQAVRAGRQRMYAEPARVCSRGGFPLDDWLVPVLYQQGALDFSFTTGVPQALTAAKPQALSPEALDAENLYGFIGRDGAILELERAMRRPPAGLLIRGLGGVGKTTLARGFLQWLNATDGLGNGCFWFMFQDIRSAEFVFNRMGEAIFGPQFTAAEMEQRLDALTKVFQESRYLIVWDNFEAVRGIPGAAVAAMLSSEDQSLLKTFLAKIRGGQSKVIITSRSSEEWLEFTNRFEIPLDGLQGEERWGYCEAILKDLGLTIDRQDADLVTLMDLLGGHPLAMRVILPLLARQKAAALIQALRSNLTAIGPSGDEAHNKLFATLRFAEESLPDELQPLLVPLALHERFVHTDFLEMMAEQVDASLTRAQFDHFFGALAVAGLLHDRGKSIFEMHPALTGFLRATRPPEDSGEVGESWSRAFVEVMGTLANRLATRELHEQRVWFFLHGANFHVALKEAERLGLETPSMALIQSLAVYAKNTRNFQEAARLYERLGAAWKSCGNTKAEAGVYGELGTVAYFQHDYATAEEWHQKSLAIKEKQGDEYGAATTYHQLGVIAEEQDDFAGAEEWYQKSLAIEDKLGNERGAAPTYAQLGLLTRRRGDFAGAEEWYQKALAIFEKQRDEANAAKTYYQLGMLAEEQDDFAGAGEWCQKALAIFGKQGDEYRVGMTYHQLGNIAYSQRDFARAEKWYQKSLAIKEKQGDEHDAAITYYQLGVLAEEHRDFAGAEKWYRKALAIEEKQGDEHGAVITRRSLEGLRKAAGLESLQRPWEVEAPSRSGKSPQVKERV